MKVLCAVLFLLACLHISAGDSLKCILKPANINVPWCDMVDPCIKAMENQVKIEVNASMTYMNMAAHFAQDRVNRPGFSKIFFESANEEREHAIKIIEYLLMRGELTNDVSRLITIPLETSSTWESGVQALTESLVLETKVTNEIRKLIATCESPKTDNNFNDYHLVDYLTSDFLDEQHKGQRKISERISTLDKMMAANGPLAEFLFDKKLLRGEL